MSRWALAWRLRAGVLFLVLVRTPTFRLCSNERQPKNQHNLAYKPHIRRCKRYFAGIAARAGRWHNKTARRSARREVERATGIEPASEAWEASILPMNYARNSSSQRNRPVDHSLTADGRATGASRPTIRHAPAESFWPRAPQADPPLTVERQVQRAHPPTCQRFRHQGRQSPAVRMRPPNRFGRAPRTSAHRSLSSAGFSAPIRPRAARPSRRVPSRDHPFPSGGARRGYTEGRVTDWRAHASSRGGSSHR